MADTKISGLPASTTPLAGTEVLPIVQGGITKQVSVNNLTAGKAVTASTLAIGDSLNSVARASFGNSSAATPAVWATFFGTNSGGAAIPPNFGLTVGWNYSNGGGETNVVWGNGLGATPGLAFSYSTGAAVNEVIRFTPLGGVSVGDTTDPGAGNLRLGTGNLVIGTSGKGIDFSADSSAAGMTSELLDDYEEGTWTPVIFGATSAGVGTYAVGGQQGIYTKIGNIVTVVCWLNWTAHTGTGDMAISGLPFGASASVNVMPGSVYASGFNAGTLATALSAHPTSSPANLALRGFVNAGTRTIPQIQASGQLAITATYRVV